MFLVIYSIRKFMDYACDIWYPSNKNDKIDENISSFFLIICNDLIIYLISATDL